MNARVILASASPFRRDMLARAGVAVEAVASSIDERAVETAVSRDITPEDLASVLAEAKAIDVSGRDRGAWVIGADQTLSLDGDIIHKSADMDQARRTLLKLSGRIHQLTSAVVLARAGEVIWRHSDLAHMTMRKLTPDYLGRYLSRTGSDVLCSVGVYQIEGEGIQLFERISGDHFTIVGLPLLPLLAELRRVGAIDG